MCAAHFVDMTPDIRLSFKLMGRKVSDMLASGKYDKSEMLPVRLCVCMCVCARETFLGERDPSITRSQMARQKEREGEKGG
jgi:hypothetical protein